MDNTFWFVRKGRQWVLSVESCTAAVLAVLVCCFPLHAEPPLPNALPTGAQVVAGQASINQQVNRMNITQTTPKLITNWQTFNIGRDAAVNFLQPNASSVALNRVLSADPSKIYGSLTANGQFFLLNPGGVIFGKGARVDVGGLAVSTLNMKDSDFLAGKYIFEKGLNAGAITNDGKIHAANGGYLAFIAPRIENNGEAIANQGTVAMAAGDKVSLDFSGDKLINFTVDKGSVDALVANKGFIKADEGEVVLTAKAADKLTQAVVNNSGIIEARTLENKAGRILIISDKESGETIVGGTLDASAPKGGDGGFIETSAAKVTYGENFIVTAGAPFGTGGLWLIDPADATIDQTIANGYATTLNTGTSVDNAVTGNITMNNNVSIAKTAGSDATLTFKASGSIDLGTSTSITSTLGKLNTVLNADSDANGGGIKMNAGSTINTNGGNIVMGGGTCTTSSCSAPAISTSATAGDKGINIAGANGNLVTINSGGGAIWMWGKGGTSGASGVSAEYSTIDSGTSGSIYMKGDGYYVLTTNGWGHGALFTNSTVRGGSGGMTLIGNANVNNPGSAQYTTAFYLENSSVYTTGGGLLSVTATANQNNGNNLYLGGSGTLGHASLQNGNISITTTGTSTRENGLPTISLPSGDLTIDTSGSAGTITQVGALTVGGATNLNAGARDITLNNASNNFTGAVTVSAGKNITLINANAMTLGAVTSTGTVDIATLTGDMTLSGNITATDTTANAIKLNAGENTAAGTATGGNILIGGSPTISTGGGGFATLYSGSTAGSTGLTTLIGSGSGRFRYNSDETDTNYTTALTTGNNAIYREQPTLTITPSSQTITYGDATPAFSATVGTAYVNGDITAGTVSGTATWTIGGTTSTSGSYIAGSHDVRYLNGLASGLGYGFVDNGTSNNELTVNQKSLTVSGITANSKVYDAGVTATLGGTAAITPLLTDVVTIGGTASGIFADKNVGTNKAVTVTGNTISGTDAGNYNLIQQTGLTGNITPATLNAGLTGTVSKTYDGGAEATLAAGNYTLSGVIGSDAVTLNNPAAGTYDTKNAGVGKTVTVTGLAVAGADAANYSLFSTTTNGGVGTIAARTLNVAYAGVNKVYDGNTTATVNTSDDRVTSDTLTINRNAAFLDKNFAKSKTVNVTGVSLSGIDKDNYIVAATGSTMADITKAPLTITATTNTKTYDGGLTASANPTVGGIQTGDTVTGLVETYDNKNAGTGKTLAVTGYTVNDGNSGNNYTVTTVADTTGVINKAPLTITADDKSKTYGDVDPVLTERYSGLIAGENASVVSGLLMSAPLGAAATAGTHVIGISGGTANNYTITLQNGTLTVAKAMLTATADDKSKSQGSGDPGLTYTANGFRYTDGPGNVFTGAISRTSGETAGEYPITQGSLVPNGNYTLTFNNGKFTITPVVTILATPIITPAITLAPTSVLINVYGTAVTPATSLASSTAEPAQPGGMSTGGPAQAGAAATAGPAQPDSGTTGGQPQPSGAATGGQTRPGGPSAFSTSVPTMAGVSPPLGGGPLVVAPVIPVAPVPPAERIVLLPGADGRTGSVVVTTAKGEVVLDKPYQTAIFTSQGEIETKTADPAEVQKWIGETLAAQPTRPISFIIYFKKGKDELADESKPTLEQCKAELLKRSSPEATVIGHTDRVGSVAYNDALSLKRAESVRQILIKADMAVAKTEVIGRGEREPAVPTKDGVPEPRNRRVEISIR